MIAAKKRPRTSTMILVSALVAVTAALIVILVLFIANLRKDRYQVKKGDVVVTIDGIKLHENQFRFFATLLLEQENAEYRLSDTNLSTLNTSLKNDVLSFAKEYIFRLREAQSAGLSLSDEEIKNLQKTFSSEYEENKKVGSRTLSKEEFYDYYYGLTEAQFTEFWKDWALIEKYNTQCEKNADVSQANQQKAFEEFEDYLAGCNTTVLELSLIGKTEAEAADQQALAKELANRIRLGADMVSLVELHCENEDLKESGGSVRITASFDAVFPELYDWSRTAEIGEVTVIGTDSAVYVVRCESFADFDALYGTEELLEWTRLFAVNEQTAELLRSDKYSFKLETDVFLALDLSSLIQAAQMQWG